MKLSLYFTAFILSLSMFSCGDGEGPPPVVATKPTVSLDALDVLEGNADKSIFASVRLSKAADEVVTIFVETEDVSAEAGTDYVAVSRSVEFPIGTVQENIKLEILGDEDSELDEVFKLKIVDAAGATIENGSIDVVIKNDDLGSGNFIIPSTGYETPEAYAGMTMIWSDEFGGTSVNTDNWVFEIGNGNWGWGNDELEFYKKENASVQDGYLVIEALEESINGFDYTSTRMKTEGKFDFQYGRVDIRAVLPEGQGVWPALWMLGSNITSVGWPRCGEIDIMELVGHQPSTVHATVHHGNSNGDHVFRGDDTSLSGGKTFKDDFHVFSLIWEEDSMKFYVDDNLYYTATPTTLGLSNPYPFDDGPFYFIFNVAVGGIWPGSPDATTSFPQHMIVDYIRVFQEE